MRILIFGTYPIKNPQHGGQKRTSAIFGEYKKAFGAVRYCGIFYRGFYKDYAADDIPVGHHSAALIRQSPLTGDIVCGEATYNDPAVRKKVSRLLTSFRPDVIHIEQPFTYLGLKPLLKELGLTPKIIFGSQNIEAPMKQEMLEGIIDGKEVKKIVKKIADLEADLSKKCDLLVACTESDMKTHSAMGAHNTVLAQNGIDKTHATPQAKAHWQHIFASQGVQKTVLFVGSAHPPNWTGFLQMVGKGLGFLPRDTRIVIAGSICDYFDRTVTSSTLEVQDATFWLRALSAGRLSEDRLSALIELADVIILPITEGGGSNLKTAEAILADKKVVATNHALRSFEWFRSFPNVWVADDLPEFHRAILKALDTPHRNRTDQEKQLAKKVRWEKCLEALVEKVKTL